MQPNVCWFGLHFGITKIDELKLSRIVNRWECAKRGIGVNLPLHIPYVLEKLPFEANINWYELVFCSLVEYRWRNKCISQASTFCSVIQFAMGWFSFLYLFSVIWHNHTDTFCFWIATVTVTFNCFSMHIHNVWQWAGTSVNVIAFNHDQYIQIILVYVADNDEMVCCVRMCVMSHHGLKITTIAIKLPTTTNSTAMLERNMLSFWYRWLGTYRWNKVKTAQYFARITGKVQWTHIHHVLRLNCLNIFYSTITVTRYDFF